MFVAKRDSEAETQKRAEALKIKTTTNKKQ